MSKIAHILAIRNGSLGDLGFGISDKRGDIEHVCESGETWIGPREVLEKAIGYFVQPIPYIVIRNGLRFLTYTRGAAGGDDRLHAKLSIGFGGHIDVPDCVVNAAGEIDLRATLVKAAERELAEELNVEVGGEHLRWTHLIQCDDTEVDQVHIGFVAQLDADQLSDLNMAFFENAIENAQWTYLADLRSSPNLESWTRLVVDSL